LPDQAILLDAGTGLFRLIQAMIDEPKESIDILLSHAHLDHVVGLTFLLDALAVTKLKHVRIFGEQEKLDAVCTHLYNQLLFPVAPSMEFIPFPDRAGVMDLKHARLEWFPLDHPGGSVGFILDANTGSQSPHANRTNAGGSRVAYITDTVAHADAPYLSKLTNIDLLMHECYFGDDQEEFAITTGHSWLSAVTRVVEKTEPGQTLLIHINPLAEILGNGFQLSPYQLNELHMSLAEDESVIEI
jgi:ribonuclease BN (tRNA processing enzyme)